MKLQPISLPERPKALRFDIKAVADARFEISADAATITIFDTIGSEVTPNRIAGALRAIGDRPVTVQINSPGGDPFDGMSIFNLLRGHSQPVLVQVLGIAASAASIVAMAGDKIEIGRGAQFMIHRAQGVALGDRDAMRVMASALEKTDAAMAGVYQARTGQQHEHIVAMMDAETFLSSDEAIALGFADALLESDAPPVRLAASQTFANRKQLEETLRRSGFPGAAASRVAAGGFPALAGEAAAPPPVDLERVLAHRAAQIRTFKQQA